MFHVMFVQIFIYRKIVVTIMALVGLLPCVFHVMLPQISISRERVVTIMALVGLLPCVLHALLLQISISRERCVTIMAFVGFLPYVSCTHKHFNARLGDLCQNHATFQLVPGYICGLGS